MKKKYKNDVILIAALLIIAVVAFVLVSLMTSNKGTEVVVKVDGKQLHALSLKKDTRLEIICDAGKNTLIIENECVYVTDSDCPDRLCENMGPISKPGQTIVCLPHKLVIEIKGEQTQLDGVAQ